MDTIQPFLTDLGRSAGDIARKYFRTEQIQAREKGTLDVITAADLAVDAYISKELRIQYPSIPILTEETAPKDFSSLVHEEYLWIVDPIDGTINYSRGDLNFCICVGLVSFGQPVAGMVFSPVRNEMYYGDIKSGIAVRNDTPIHVSTTDLLKETVLCLDRGKQPEVLQASIDVLERTKGKVLQVKLLGSSALAMCFLAEGMIDGYFHKHLYPWDVAASSAIAKAAGALIENPFEDDWSVFSPSVFLSSPGIRKQLKAFIRG